MALVNPGPSGELAGTIGGTTYARNRAGAYARAWAKPVNPNTTAQSIVRANFQYGSGMWATLTLVQKQAWNDYAATVTRQNRFGASYTPSGRQLFMELATNAMTLGATPLSVPPVELTVPGLAIASATLTTAAGPPVTVATIDLNGISVTNSTNPSVCFYGTPLQPSSRTNYKKALRFLGYDAPPAPGDPLDIDAFWEAIFGNPTIAPTMQYIGLAVRVIDGLTFLGSSKLYVAATV